MYWFYMLCGIEQFFTGFVHVLKGMILAKYNNLVTILFAGLVHVLEGMILAKYNNLVTELCDFTQFCVVTELRPAWCTGFVCFVIPSTFVLLRK